MVTVDAENLVGTVRCDAIWIANTEPPPAQPLLIPSAEFFGHHTRQRQRIRF